MPISIYVRLVPVKRVIKLREKIRLLDRSLTIIIMIYSYLILIDRNLLFELKY